MVFRDVSRNRVQQGGSKYLASFYIPSCKWKRDKKKRAEQTTTECTEKANANRNKGAATSAIGLLFKLLVETVSGSFCRCHGLFRIGVNGYSCREYWRLIDKAGKLEAKNAITFVAVI